MFTQIFARCWQFDAVMHRAGLVRMAHHRAPAQRARIGASALASPLSGGVVIAPALAGMPFAAVSNRSAQQGEEAK